MRFCNSDCSRSVVVYLPAYAQYLVVTWLVHVPRTPYNHLPVYSVTSFQVTHVGYTYVGEACHLHFWQNDPGVLNVLLNVLLLFTPLNCCMSTLRLVHYALHLTPACWKSNKTNARLMAFAPSLALDTTFGIQSHKTLDTAQPCHLLKPN